MDRRLTARESRQLYRRLLTYVLPYKWGFAAALGGMVLVALGDAAIVAYVQPTIDQGFVGRDPAFVRWMPLFFLGFGTLRAAGNLLDGFCMPWVARRAIQDLRQLMFERFLRAPARYFDKNSSGALTARLIYDVEQVADTCTSALRVLFRDSIKAVLLLSWMFYISWTLSLLFCVIIPLAAVVYSITSEKLRAINLVIQKSVGGINDIAHEALRGHRLVKIFDAYGYQNRLFYNTNNFHRQQSMKTAAVGSVSVALVVVLTSTGVAFVLWLALNLEITTGGFSSYILAMTTLTKPIRNLAAVNLEIQSGLAGAESVFRTMDLEQERDDGTKISRMGDVRFDHVVFAYSRNKPVLKNVSFDIKEGTTAALVGISGSGKSTIASLLLRFYTPTSGQISVGGQPLDSLTLQSLRAHTAIVTQEIMLFDDTISGNIAYGEMGEIDQQRLRQAAAAANVLEFTDAMPAGLDTIVGESGVRLSGGQRQRVAIARALYKDAPLLIMDEATSSLDSQSEQHIQTAIGRLLKNRTSLIIAHRLSTIENADQILVMEAGRVVQRGRHEELIKQRGVYARLQAAQHKKPPQETKKQTKRRPRIMTTKAAKKSRA